MTNPMKDLTPEQQKNLAKIAEKFRRSMQKTVNSSESISSISISSVTDEGTKEILRFEKK